MIIFGLGTNLGERENNLAIARDYLSEHFPLIKQSTIIETKAILPENAPPQWDIPYLNQVVMMRAGDYDHATEYALQILKICKEIEQMMGREDIGRWSPRIIDIDILIFGDHEINLPELIIPHQELQNRDFFLQGIREIRGEVF